MGVKCTTPQKSVDELLSSIPQIVYDEIFRSLSFLGEQCIKKIRDRPGKQSWFDQTGNLRSSIGYAIFSEGRKIIESSFAMVKNGAQGSADGKKLIDELANKYSETFALVVVAGMEYAEFVEAHENKDVLATTELWAKQEVKKYLDNAIERAYGKILDLQLKLGL